MWRRVRALVFMAFQIRNKMNYEQKYKEALEKLRAFHRDYKNISHLVDVKGELESIFPELKESEDERIRKELLDHCINRRDGKQICVDASDYRRWAAWLEKQANIPHFTFDDILALQCAMKATEKADNELYEQLKSLHDRLNDVYWLEKQGEKSWSEEDDDNIKCICSYLELYLNHTADINEIEECKYLKDWLKSLKPQNHWKPSEEQLNALKQCIGGYYSEEADKKLESLYDDLKKL